jgi:hypothetical protein
MQSAAIARRRCPARRKSAFACAAKPNATKINSREAGRWNAEGAITRSLDRDDLVPAVAADALR